MADLVEETDMAESTCSVENCDKPVNCRGWCKSHYRRWSLYGDPVGIAPPRAPRPPKVKPPCGVEGCDRPQYAKGWCEPHYARVRRHGGLHDERARTGDARERFWSKVEVTDSCWLWSDPPNGSGYGSFRVNGRTVGAHVYAVLLDGRAVPPGMEVDHLCYTPLCVRPDHLDVVTHEENVRRSVERRAA